MPGGMRCLGPGSLLARFAGPVDGIGTGSNQGEFGAGAAGGTGGAGLAGADWRGAEGEPADAAGADGVQVSGDGAG